MKKIDNLDFFRVDTKTLAQNLIGKWIYTCIGGVEVCAQICETEAYLGIDDSACHSYQNKRTARTEPMWQDGGTIYVYLCYGLHYLFNIVSKNVEEPEAVLIRGVVGAEGPARATKLLNITKELNGQKIVGNPLIYLLDDGEKYSYTTAPRVGIDYAKPKDKNAKLRYILTKKHQKMRKKRKKTLKNTILE